MDRSKVDLVLRGSLSANNVGKENVMQMWNAGGTAGLLNYIRERSDDIEKAVIPQHLSIVFHPGEEQVQAGLVLHLISGETLIVREKEDAEAVLNDGILNRMKIRIELLR